MNAETQKMIAEADARLGREMEEAIGPVPETPRLVTGTRFSDCVVAEPDPIELEKIRQAVEFYTATPCTIKEFGDSMYWVTAVGYRYGPAGP
jgi:hypothetical protein